MNRAGRALLFSLVAFCRPAPPACAQTDWDSFFDGRRPRLELDASLKPRSAPGSTADAAHVNLLLKAHQSDRRASVWPGFSVLDQPVLIYDEGKRSFLIAHPAPPADYQAVTSAPPAVFEKQGSIPDLKFAFQFHRLVNGIDTFAYRYTADDKPASAVSTIVHERFHVHQEKWFSAERRAERRSEPDAEDLALAALEQAALKSALAATDPLQSSRSIRRFLAARAARYARRPDGRAPENHEERMEGMAEYVELSLLERPEVAPTRLGMIGKISRRLAAFPEIDDMEKHRYYATGAAQGLLLERGGPKDWKEQVSAGAAPHDLLAAAYPLPAAERAVLLAEAKTAYGYDALLRSGTALAAEFQAAKARALAEYAALGGAEWTIPIPWSDSTNFGVGSHPPSYKLGENEELLPHMKVVDVRAEGFSLHLTARPVVIGSGVRFHADAAAVTLDGRVVPLSDGRHAFDTLALNENGVELSVARPGTLTVSGRRVVVAYR